jgi:hypothetical protein
MCERAFSLFMMFMYKWMWRARAKFVFYVFNPHSSFILFTQPRVLVYGDR